MPRVSLLLFITSVTACQSAATPGSGPSSAGSAGPALRPSSAASRSASVAAAEVDRIGQTYLDALLAHRPMLGYFIDRPPARHDGFENNSPEALKTWRAVEDRVLERLRGIEPATLEGTPQWITHGALKESLEASVQRRVCNAHLWGVSQMRGWQVSMMGVLREQPVSTADERAQALTRWAKLPAYLRTEIDLLKRGLSEGYSATKSVVRRVIQQVDGYLSLPMEKDPFFALSTKAGDKGFEDDLRALVSDAIRPAVTEYRDFLRQVYLPGARAALSVTANKDGRACYEAMLRGYTTLARSPEDVFALGQKTVDANRAVVIEKGHALFGTRDYAEILRRLKTVDDDKFEDRDGVIAFARARVEVAEKKMASFFAAMPADKAVVQPYPAHLDGTGVSSRYEAPKQGGPGTYRIAVNDPKQARRGREEIVAYHETYPGHHLQIAIEQRLKGVHPVGRVTRNSAFIEGWARYGEALAEEAGLYAGKTGPIYRRTWPARGMVVDPGIHVMGWDRDKAAEFLMDSGRFDRVSADRMIDRIATIPGQLTSYDSGALEIFALRAAAEEKLGDRFDIKAFHQAVLENGTIPLWMLRSHLMAWIAAH